MANDGWIQITSQTFTGSESTVTFSNISQNYDHLVIFASLGGTSASYGYINGTNSIPVFWHTMYANGGYNVDTVNEGEPSTYFYAYGNNNTNGASAQWWQIPFYSKNDNWKCMRLHSNSAASSGNEFGGMWVAGFGTQDPVTSITVNSSASWSSGSLISLYGLVAK